MLKIEREILALMIRNVDKGELERIVLDEPDFFAELSIVAEDIFEHVEGICKEDLEEKFEERLESELQQSYEEGKTDGYEDGYATARNEFEGD